MRWKPTRAGIFNVWEYDDHVFEFGDGRLVLRGRNGSGKSNALSLLFPFLLDGVMSAARMDPMGGSRSMKSLLLGRDDDDRAGSFRHDSGTGYVWMELANGTAHTTIGVGASATVHRDADAWFFVTAQRVGHDLQLAEDEVPLSRRQLAERLHDGATFDTAEEFRAAVDRTLFGLGATRYRSLLDLLLTLRRPHLAGKLDTDHLSATLSAGLGELDPDLIADVAHSFDDLDAMQHELEGLATSLDAVERFLPTYREHLVGVARARAEAVVGRHGELRRVAKDRDAAASERDEATRSLERIGAQEASAVDEQRRIEAEIDHVQQSPAYQSATALAEVRRAADKAAEVARHAATQAGDREGEAAAAEQAASEATATAAAASTAVDEAIAEWSATAATVGIDPPFDPGAFDPERATAVVVARQAELDEVTGRAHAAAAAVQAAQDAEAAAARQQTVTDRAEAARDGAAGEVEAVRARLAQARGSWRAELDELLAPLAALLDQPLPGLSEPGATAASVDDAGDPSVAADPDVATYHSLERWLGEIDTLAARGEDAAGALATAQREAIESLAAERDRVASEPNPGPPPNPTRPDAQREDRDEQDGVPLYVCVDFADHVDQAARAGLEAALGAAGLLDARITTGDGTDAALDARLVGPGGGAVPEQSLADVLVPVATGPIDDDRIASVLRSVPLADDVVELHSDGRWRLGPLAGRYEQADQRYIGHEARERRRTRRLAELDRELAEQRAALDGLEDHHRRLVEHRRELREARDRQPAVAPLTAALGELERRSAVLEEHLDALRAARAEVEQRWRKADEATSTLHRAAAAARLPVEIAELTAIEQALRECDRRRDDVGERRRTLEVARRASERAEAAHREAAERADQAAEAARAAATEADAEARRYEDLRANVGGDAEAAIERLAEARRRRTENEALRGRLARERSALEQQLATLRERIAQLEGRHAGVLEAVRAAEASFAVVCSAEVADVLALEGVEPGAEARSAARRVLSDTDVVDDDATNRMERAHREVLLDGLRAGHDPSMPKVDGVDVVRVGTAEGELPIGTLANQLRFEHERTSQLLSKQEREIFETHLLTRVGDALRQLLLEADEFEHRINDEMAAAPTESGMVVELRWEVTSDEPGLRNAVQTLRTAPEMLGPDRREALREFFMQRIADLRSSDPGRSFAETLTAALDYRSWHRFALFARFADGKRQRVTRAFYKGLSGGEAATLLHLPLFAAAAAQYSSGSIAGPRLIALDEAFAGIDEQMRARLMGLLRQLDLDVILTSHELWGFYGTVPSLVVYDLVRRPPNPGVFAQRFDWSAGEVAEPGAR